MKTDHIVNAASEYLSTRKEVVFAYLFGSQVKGRITKMSDIDVAVYFAEAYVGKIDKLKFLQALSEAVGTDALDLVVLNMAPVTLVYKILQNQIVLIDRNPAKRHIFESLNMRKYFDFSFLEKNILDRRYG